ncbi:E3 ubiquitin-protein ligase TRIM38 [Tenrec ecaudatus]|uniref:E3 ubiquitin-protein ligase TRIM38 n=1 Tax=Tenrec ecaudatus TaxID=94439 RepID=UPI003F590CCF
MASPIPTKKLKDEATCAICLSLMTNPVSISCGHSYCQKCIMDFLQNPNFIVAGKEKFCPQCRAPFEEQSLRPNKQLGNLIQAIKEMSHEIVCEEHGEQLQLFCEDEGQLICWRCERAPQHKGHTTSLVEDVCYGYKKKLLEAVTYLSKLNNECVNMKVLTTEQISEWKGKIDVQRKRIKSDFKSLHSFLREEEKLYLWRLKKEEEQTIRRLKYNNEILEEKQSELQCAILELELKCQSSPQILLKDVKNTLNRSWAVKLERPEAVSLDLSTTCNIPELYFDVKRKLRSYQVNVTLDPDTAHPKLIISEDRRQVTLGCCQENLSSSPRRFSAFRCVLGCEGFSSGRHFFEVYVGEGTGWDIGVCRENVQRDQHMNQMPESGFWTIKLCKEKGYIALSSPPVHLHLSEQPLVVGVFLDYEMGYIAFYNMTTGSQIFTFPKASFSNTLQPYFQVYPYSPLFLPSSDE